MDEAREPLETLRLEKQLYPGLFLPELSSGLGQLPQPLRVLLVEPKDHDDPEEEARHRRDSRPSLSSLPTPLRARRLVTGGPRDPSIAAPTVPGSRSTFIAARVRLRCRRLHRFTPAAVGVEPVSSSGLSLPGRPVAGSHVLDPIVCSPVAVKILGSVATDGHDIPFLQPPFGGVATASFSDLSFHLDNDVGDHSAGAGARGRASGPAPGSRWAGREPGSVRPQTAGAPGKETASTKARLPRLLAKSRLQGFWTFSRPHSLVPARRGGPWGRPPAKSPRQVRRGDGCPLRERAPSWSSLVALCAEMESLSTLDQKSLGPTPFLRVLPSSSDQPGIWFPFHVPPAADRGDNFKGLFQGTKTPRSTTASRLTLSIKRI